MSPVTDHPVDVPPSAKSDAVTPVTASPKVTSKDSESALVGVADGVMVTDGVVDMTAGAYTSDSARFRLNADALLS